MGIVFVDKDSNKIMINQLDLEILISDMLYEARNQHELDFIQEAITDTVESIACDVYNGF